MRPGSEVSTKRRWQRSTLLKLGGGVLALGLVAGTGWIFENAPAAVRFGQGVQPVFISQGPLPFSARQIIKALSQATGKPPARTGGDTTVFESAADSRPEDYYRISVVTRGSAITVVFSTGSQLGLNYARELFEAPLFEPGESRQLYALYAKSRPHASAQLPRFAADLSFVSWDDLFVLTLRFTPKLQPRTVLR